MGLIVSQQAQPESPKHFLNKKFAITFVVLLLLGAGTYAGIWYWGKQQAGQDTITTPTPTKTADSNIKTFNSNDLGISFTYLADQDGDGVLDMTAEQSGDKVYVGGSDGQWVQVWKKDPKLTLTQSITGQILKGYSPKDCYVQVSSDRLSDFPDSYVRAEISYPKAGDMETSLVNFKKCPQGYSQTNGVRFFLMDKNHPDRFAYFDIGQYAILGDANNHDWVSTFRFTDLSGSFCGGIGAIQCSSGYSCKLEGTYPDAGGTCIKGTNN